MNLSNKLSRAIALAAVVLGTGQGLAGAKQQTTAWRQEPASARASDSQGPANIRWEPTLIQAFHDALNQHKPMIVFFYQPGGRWSEALKAVLASPQVLSLADKAVFAEVASGYDDQNKNASRLIGSLNIKEFPVVAVLDVYPSQIDERGRVTGYYDASDFYFQLSQVLLMPVQTLQTVPATTPARTGSTAAGADGSLTGSPASTGIDSQNSLSHPARRP